MEFVRIAAGLGVAIIGLMGIIILIRRYFQVRRDRYPIYDE